MFRTEVHICWTIDCEATQQGIANPELGRRSVRGFVDVVTAAGMRPTLFVLPGDATAYPQLLRQLAAEGVEIGLHFHPQEDGYDDYCGSFTAEEQYAMYSRARAQLADAIGFEPFAFRTGSCSANDATFPVTAELGFSACSHSMPGRNLIHLRSSWAGASARVHYAHAANRLLEGELDLVEVPISTDPDSMLWSGGHPQDLRVELFDAKNQRYLIDKLIQREKASDGPCKAIVALTHNVFQFGDPSDFRGQTLGQMLADMAQLAERHEVLLRPSTISEVAAAYRQARPLAQLNGRPSERATFSSK
jgi:peptidoglycan/xylan/chitin deacetylase (PgdA/CDA1 family)